MGIVEKQFGKTQGDKKVYLYEITTQAGAMMQVSNYGAVLVSLLVPDHKGEMRDVVLGYDDVTSYENGGCYFGATIGRSGNRIAKGAFTINGKSYQLPINENDNNLHSGPDGYQTKIWEVKALDEGKNSITFYRHSSDGEQGYPGNFNIAVTYELSEDNELSLHYEGSSDQDTIANMTNHSYFNLAGAQNPDASNQELQIHAQQFTPVIDKASIPTGELQEVKGTPMDFTIGKPMNRDLDMQFEQLALTGGYDHNFVLEPSVHDEVREVAKAYCKESGIAMTVSTDLPGIQFYGGNFIHDELGKQGIIYQAHAGFCLETQYFPNAVNEVGFESPILKADEIYQTTTIYRFTVE